MDLRGFRMKSVAVTLTLVLMISALIPGLTIVSNAAVPSLETIRVALFIQGRNTTPVVTVQSPEGLRIGLRTPSATKAWFEEGNELRSAVDQYLVQLMETTDYQAAVTARNSASQVIAGVSIFQKVRAGSTIYQVMAHAPTKQEAGRLLDTYKQQSFVHARIIAPHYVSIGSHQGKQAAEQQLAAATAAGLDAVYAVHEQADGILAHSVWLYGAADEAGLGFIKAEAAKHFPSASLTQVDMSQPYLIQRSDVTTSSQQAIPFYAFNASGQRMIVESKTEQPLTVKERSNRSYRGQMELTQYGGQLAVINELPFEAYLYSVVGTEMGGNWPLEALKAQAVAARTYALSVGVKYGIAHVSDTTYEQAYSGMQVEAASIRQAVDETKGVVIVNASGNLIEALYYSNAGGMTADGSEIWGRTLDYAKSVPSPDQNATEGLLQWNRVILPSGEVGYIRSDYTRETGRVTDAGLAILQGTADGVNVRNAPFVNDTTNPAIAKMNSGDELVLLEQHIQSNPFSWLYGPFTSEELLTSINRVASTKIEGPLHTLEVTKRGPSGRATEIKANGTVIQVSTPDTYRTAFKSLPSTRFEIENSAQIHVLGANGQTRTTALHASDMSVLTAKGTAGIERSSYAIAVNGEGQARYISAEPAFRFFGNGFGHGLGMSQYGAKEMAEFLGYDYERILKYYYQGIDLVKSGQ